MFSRLQIVHVTVVHPNQEGLLCLLQRVAPFSRGDIHCQQLSVPDVIITPCWAELLQQECSGLDLVVFRGPLSPDTHVRSVDFHNELVLGVQDGEHRGRCKSVFQGAECLFGCSAPSEVALQLGEDVERGADEWQGLGKKSGCHLNL